MSKKSNKTSPAAIQIGLHGIVITEDGLKQLRALTSARAAAASNRAHLVNAVVGLVAELNKGRRLGVEMMQKRITMMRIVGDWKAADRLEAEEERQRQREELNRLMERLDRMGPMHH